MRAGCLEMLNNPGCAVVGGTAGRVAGPEADGAVADVVTV